MKPATGLLLALLGLAACSPAPQPAAPAPIETRPPEPQPTQPSRGDATPFLGHWRQSSVVLAPWWKGKGDKPEPDPSFAEVDTVLAANSSSGPGIVTCQDAIYTATTLPPEGLFEGNLPEPAKQAAALGFKGAEIPTLMQGCRSSTGDLELLFHLVDSNTMLLGLDNLIYTLKRVPEPPDGWPKDADAPAGGKPDAD